MRVSSKLILAGFFVATGCLSAQALPTWMGVYGAFQRHNGENPGAFTILMNQDYYGLHAEVGIQINGGTWATYPMIYTANTDGNSQWGFTPATAFPAGASVQYYFHGFDDWGGSIYDSQNGNNYTFTVPGGGTNTQTSWGAPKQIPINMTYVSSIDVALYNGTLYAIWTAYNDNGSSERMFFSKRALGGEWQAPVDLQIAGMTYPKLAVSASGIHVVYTDYLTAHYIRSTNEGAAWSAPISFTVAGTASRHMEVRADADYLYAVYDDFTAPETSRVYFRRIHRTATAWEPQVSIFNLSSYKTTVYIRDFEVRGARLFLTAFGQSWYGGFSSWSYYESVNSGSTWTLGTHQGYNSQLDADAAGDHAYLATCDSSAQGGGIYFASRVPGGSWSASQNVWPGNGSVDAMRRLANLHILVSQANGQRYCRTSQDNGQTWGLPQLIQASSMWCVKDVADANGAHLLLMEADGSGRYYTLSMENAPATPVQWVGNTYHWPPDNELDASDQLWINTESYPKGAGVSARVVFSTNGTTWTNAPLEYAGTIGNNDAWHANLGTFPAGATVQYAVVVQDGAQGEIWDNNSSQDYRAHVASAMQVYQPVFWALDPYRFDNEKVRANGRAADASTHNMGIFEANESIVVVARPVENGNGNSVQMGPVSMVSKLHYTTTPGNWDNAVTVTGVFHAAGMSNKPIFDNYSYDLGAFPGNATVYFWLEAHNTAGDGYAQAAGQDYWFTTSGAGDGDTDKDGLPDQWEMDYIGNLSQNATNNPDADGASGRPMDNIIEYAVGTSPTVPNDPMGQTLLWTPSHPQPGGTVTLSYFYVNEGNPLFGRPIYAHVGHDGWQEVYDSAQLQLNGQISRFEITLSIPANATQLNVVFHNNAGIWDNNSGKDWTIPLKTTNIVRAGSTPAAKPPTPAPTPKTTMTSGTPAAAVPAPETRLASRLSEPTQRMLQVTLNATKTKGPIYLFLGTEGFQNKQLIAMTPVSKNVYAAQYVIPANSGRVHLAFVNKKRKWVLNQGHAWTYEPTVAASQTLAITE